MPVYFDIGDKFTVGKEEGTTPAPPDPFRLGANERIELSNSWESGPAGGRVI